MELVKFSPFGFYFSRMEYKLISMTHPECEVVVTTYLRLK